MPYIDAFVLPVPKKNLAAYRRLAQKGARIWRKHGALEYRECVGEDLAVKFGVPFPRMLKPRRGETVVFSWIMYRSRAHRDAVNGRAMQDPAMHGLADPKKMPFDCSRMVCGGFEVLVDA